MSTKKNLSLGDFLRVHRLGEEMSQLQMAKALKISKQRLCDIENGRGSVSVKLAKEMARKLKLPPEWLAKLVIQDLIRQEGLKLKVS